MATTTGEVFNGARALLNDQEDAIYHNEVLMEYFKLAYDRLGQACEDYNIPITSITSEAISIPQGVTDIGGPTGPALPNDLIEVMQCWEIPAGTNNDYMLMRHQQFLPKTSVLTSYLEVWTWQNQYVNFLGANGDIQVKLDYIADNLGTIRDKNSIIRLTNARLFLKYATAALAAMFIGENEDRAKVLGSLGDDALDVLLNIKIKNQQGIQTRRRPFMSNYKRRGGLYGR